MKARRRRDVNRGLIACSGMLALVQAAAAQTWSNALLLNDPVFASTDIKEAHIVAAANGFHAIYRVTSNSRIQYRRYYNGSLKTAQDVFPASNFAANGNLGVALDGTVHVVLEDWGAGGGAPEVRWYKFNVDDNTGAISNKVTQVLSNSGGTAKHPHISPYGLSGGQMVMSYYRSGSTGGGSKQLWYAVYSGSSWTAEASVGSTCNSEYECFGQSRAPDGSVWRSFTDSGNLKIRRYSGTWGPDVSLDNNGQMHNRQRLSVNDAGQVMVVWDESEALWSILYTPGSGVGAKTQISSQNSWFQGACAIPGSNNFQAAYPKNSPHPARCYSKKWTSGAWQAEETVAQSMPNGDAFTVQPEMSGSLDNSGTVYCIWEYWGSGKPQQYYSIKLGSPPGPTGTLAGTVRDQFGVGIPGASVSVAPQGTTISGAGGAYSFQVPAGTTSATASKTYYLPHTRSDFTIVQNQTTTRDFTITGQSPGEVTALSAAAGNAMINLQWTNPNVGNYTGTRIMFKIGSAPTGINDAGATLLLDDVAAPGSTRTTTHNNVTNGQTYYYRAFTYWQDLSRFYSSGNAPTTAVAALSIDFDKDGDVDMIDFAHLQVCLTGANVTITNPACNNANIDGAPDTDVDGDDMNLFLGCLSGPGVYANPTCLP